MTKSKMGLHVIRYIECKEAVLHVEAISTLTT